MSLFDLQDVCIAIGSIATLDLPMVVDLIGIYGLKGPYFTLAMSLFDLQDVCIAIGSIATLDLPMVVDLIGIYGLKGPYCTLTTTDWFLQALSVIPRGSWGDVSRRFTMIRWAVAPSSPRTRRRRPRSAAAAADRRRKIVSGQFDEENPFVLISTCFMFFRCLAGGRIRIPNTGHSPANSTSTYMLTLTGTLYPPPGAPPAGSKPRPAEKPGKPENNTHATNTSPRGISGSNPSMESSINNIRKATDNMHMLCKGSRLQPKAGSQRIATTAQQQDLIKGRTDSGHEGEEVRELPARPLRYTGTTRPSSNTASWYSQINRTGTDYKKEMSSHTSPASSIHPKAISKRSVSARGVQRYHSHSRRSFLPSAIEEDKILQQISPYAKTAIATKSNDVAENYCRNWTRHPLLTAEQLTNICSQRNNRYLTQLKLTQLTAESSSLIQNDVFQLIQTTTLSYSLLKHASALSTAQRQLILL
ncbi:protein IQ-DOMAIN 1-like [Dorcoceras hygrometricum]|uniref:Protein IQ-DOMAIN 1-like n=1 Tax=Dorcoceras hygrometricum TaxID=472368 RepID=A0A2Z7BXL3_9LAMI|nr:protein IQ-DOMAIN 1-like [Dorcoceras hygrometricum]